MVLRVENKSVSLRCQLLNNLLLSEMVTISSEPSGGGGGGNSKVLTFSCKNVKLYFDVYCSRRALRSFSGGALGNDEISPNKFVDHSLVSLT